MSAREQILTRVCEALGRARAEDLETHTHRFQHLIQNSPPPNPVNIRVDADTSQCEQTFCDVAGAANTRVLKLAERQDLAHWLQENLPEAPASYIEPGPCLSHCDLSELNISERYAEAGQCAVVEAICGIAETGSVVLASSATHPTAAGFLPDHLIVVLETATIVPHIEGFMDRLPSAPLPRAINMITGPSRTADVEQKVQLGAHGPRALTVVLVP